MRRRLRWAGWASALALVVPVVALVGSPRLREVVYANWLIYCHDPFGGASFDPAVWKAGRPSPSASSAALRGPMTTDLRRRFLRPGTPRSWVLSALGPPDGGMCGLGPKCDSYYLGRVGPLSIDGQVLAVHYDAAGRVVRTEILEF